MAKDNKNVNKNDEEEVKGQVIDGQEQQEEAAPEEPKKADEKKTWKQRHAEKKAKFAEEHPKAAKLIDSGKKIGVGVLAGVVLKTGADVVKSMLGNRSNGSGSSDDDNIITTYTEVDNNNSNN